MHPIRYRDDVEVVPAEEDEVVADIVAMMRKSLQEAFDTHRQIASGTHAKTHGVVTGRLTVGDDLPPERAQGLFAQPGTYEIVLRYSSEPGTIETDTVPRARGASLKVLSPTSTSPKAPSASGTTSPSSASPRSRPSNTRPESAR